MKQKRRKRILQALAILRLCFPFALHAASGDDFIRGYASAVLQREFRLENFSLNVTGEAVTVRSGELTEADHGKVLAVLSSIDGVKQVAILDSRGVEVATSSPQASETRRAIRQIPVREYEFGLLPGGNLFEPPVADPRWPRFSIGYRYFTDEATNVASATFGETIALYRSRGPYDGLWEVGFQAGVFSIFDLDSSSFDLVNSDFFAALHATYRIGDLSTFFRVLHQSSHLGDEFLLRNRIDRINLSFEGLDLKLSYTLSIGFACTAAALTCFTEIPRILNPGQHRAVSNCKHPGDFGRTQHGSLRLWICKTGKKTSGARKSRSVAAFNLKGLKGLAGGSVCWLNITRDILPTDSFLTERLNISDRGCTWIFSVAPYASFQAAYDPNSAVQSDTPIKGRTLRNERNRSVADSGLQAPVL